MKFLIIGVFVIIAGALILRSMKNTDPVQQACAREIGALFRSAKDVKPQAIADVFIKHGIPRSQCPSVGKMVIGQLHKHGLEPDDSRIAMITVREAYSLVPEGK
ncbi:hypothetical protein D777_01644 [Marinobacter nitratireducens]|uniref:Uncharacterized protein n=1 Tax=Marinobacter nitratireducens TaxID=1137280 RepID=A0A072NDY1_9GAMM|nr:hypothetical protein [Marinobacter nitratireducens]KEF31295.1 hypothetical protein D777_01644 [Marinobacter nitratireducens]